MESAEKMSTSSNRNWCCWGGGGIGVNRSKLPIASDNLTESPGMLQYLMFSCRMIQKHKDKAFDQLTAQMNEKFKIEDDRLARGAAEVEVEYQMQNKEKEMRKKAAIESIEENRVTVVRNEGCPCSYFCHRLVCRNNVWKCHSFHHSHLE